MQSVNTVGDLRSLLGRYDDSEKLGILYEGDHIHVGYVTQGYYLDHSGGGTVIIEVNGLG